MTVLKRATQIKRDIAELVDVHTKIMEKERKRDALGLGDLYLKANELKDAIYNNADKIEDRARKQSNLLKDLIDYDWHGAYHESRPF